MGPLKIALAILPIITSTTAQAVNSFPYVTNQSIWQPGRGVEESIYPRYVELLDGTIRITSSQTLFAESDALNYFPVFASSDGGASWDLVSNITDQVNGWGFGAQPALWELSEAHGDYDAVTILASDNSWSESVRD